MSIEPRPEHYASYFRLLKFYALMVEPKLCVHFCTLPRELSFLRRVLMRCGGA